MSASGVGAAPRASIGDGDETFLGHFPDGISRSFAPETTIFDATKRHDIDPGAGGFVDVNTTKPKLARYRQSRPKIRREQSGRKSERTGVGTRHRIFDV